MEKRIGEYQLCPHCGKILYGIGPCGCEQSKKFFEDIFNDVDSMCGYEGGYLGLYCYREMGPDPDDGYAENSKKQEGTGMDIFIGERGSGKTDRVVRYASEHGLTIVSHDAALTESYINMLIERKEISNRPGVMSYGEMARGGHRGSGERYIIDDIELFLKTVFTHRVEGFSMGGDGPNLHALRGISGAGVKIGGLKYEILDWKKSGEK